MGKARDDSRPGSSTQQDQGRQRYGQPTNQGNNMVENADVRLHIVRIDPTNPREYCHGRTKCPQVQHGGATEFGKWLEKQFTIAGSFK